MQGRGEGKEGHTGGTARRGPAEERKLLGTYTLAIYSLPTDEWQVEIENAKNEKVADQTCKTRAAAIVAATAELIDEL